jgi:N-acetyl sugar amidotransferase
MNKKNPLEICERCVMDSSALGFYSSATGCNYCDDFASKIKSDTLYNNESRQSQLETLILKIKADGKGKKYDCIIGLSGGVDSSWVLYLAKKHGLRPLAVHMDNGWNSELSQENIQNLVTKLNVDLYTYVIDWNEYKSLQQAFFNADVIDIELLYDNALYKVNHMLASRYGLKYLLSGSNTSTEGMQMPLNWAYKNKLDKTNILSIWKYKGLGTKLKSFPSFGYRDQFYYRMFKGIKWASFLDYFDYKKEEAITTLQSEVGYRPYLYKHYESVFTRFYQGFLLPEKFGADKRKVHLSTLIITGQMTRNEAVDFLKLPPYFSISELESDKDYFLKKMNWSESELYEYLSRPEIDHEFYGTENPIWDKMVKLKMIVYSLKKYYMCLVFPLL